MLETILKLDAFAICHRLFLRRKLELHFMDHEIAGLNLSITCFSKQLPIALSLLLSSTTNYVALMGRRSSQHILT